MPHHRHFPLLQARRFLQSRSLLIGSRRGMSLFHLPLCMGRRDADWRALSLAPVGSLACSVDAERDAYMTSAATVNKRRHAG